MCHKNKSKTQKIEGSELKMRRLFIIRKDLNLSPGKLSAMVSHCAEAYWTKLISEHVVGEIYQGTGGNQKFMKPNEAYRICFDVDKNIFDDYINGIFVKTICAAKNRNHLIKAKNIAEELGLIEDKDFGFINDCCFTELTPENEDGTCTVGIWFKPLPDEISHAISKKYQLY